MVDNTQSVNTDKMLAAASGLGGLADEAGKIFGDLLNRLLGAGQAWGTDAAGRAFGVTYQSPCAAFMQTATGMKFSLGATSEKATTMANGFNTTEEDNAASINRGSGSGSGSGGSSGGSGISGGGSGSGSSISGGGSGSGGGGGSGSGSGGSGRGGNGGPALGD